MNKEKIIAGIILLAIGLIFFFNNENIGRGACKFYQKLYTEKNLKVMFKVAGVILILGSAFYWYELRPTSIKKECYSKANEAKNNLNSTLTFKILYLQANY